MKRIFAIIICLIIALNLFSQTILKKKEVSELLPQISKHIESHLYELAIEEFYSEKNIILEENVNKKLLEDYISIKNVLSKKKLIFDENARLVNFYFDEYRKRNFSNSTKLLELELNKENSYFETRDLWNSYQKKILTVKQKCLEEEALLEKLRNNYLSKNYEETFYIFKGIFDLEYFSPTDLKEYNELKEKLKILYDEYNTLMTDFSNQMLYVNGIDFQYIDYNKSIELLNQINAYLKKNKEEIIDFKNNNPIIFNKYEEINQLLINLKNVTEEFSVNNRLIAPNDLSNIIFSEKEISMAFIKAQCKYVGGEQIDKSHYLYNLDIVNLLDEWKNKSDLQKEVFKQTEEYKAKYHDFNIQRERMICASYVALRPFKDIKYDMEKKAFNINSNIVRSNIPFILSHVKPPKCVDYVEILQLPYFLLKGEALGYIAWEDFLLLEANVKEALKIEENGEDIELLFIFNIVGSYNKEYDFTGANGKLNLSDTVFKTKKLRVVAFNTKTNEMYYNRLYK